MEHKQTPNPKSDLLALFLAIIALHFLVLAFVLAPYTKLLFFVVIIDSIIAIVLGSRTHTNYGHGGLILGLFTAIVSGIAIMTSL